MRAPVAPEGQGDTEEVMCKVKLDANDTVLDVHQDDVEKVCVYNILTSLCYKSFAHILQVYYSYLMKSLWPRS